jgi:predicted phage-related endonuclease
MSMTPEELERRRRVVGASEVGLLFGLPSYGGRTMSDLWWLKKFGTERESKGNASTALGTKLEPTILEMAEDKLGSKIIDRQRWVTRGCNAATLDGRVSDSGAVIDAKTSGILGPHRLDEWGESGSDDVPAMYLIQIQAQMLVAGEQLGYIAALIGGRGFDLFEIQPHAALMQAIETKSTEFIASLDGDTAPDEPPTLDTLKRLKRQPNKVIERSDELDNLWFEYQDMKASLKEYDKEVEARQRKLLAKLGDAEMAETRDGFITYYSQTTRYPARLPSESTFRVLRLKKGK